MKHGFIRRFRRNERGAAAIEFAMLSLFFFSVVIVALDFAVYVQQNLRLGQAVEQGAILAFNTRNAPVPADIANFVRATAGLTTTPTVTCNNATCQGISDRTDTSYRCIDATSGLILTTTYKNGATCASGGNAGYYLRIVATRPYAAVVVPNKWLGGTTMTQTVVVRLQ
ncbi:TadE/TadG family type IV pilus assembly protein [uncultured Sphingomonas sp.]|uniref:TadE/TadG family type IV pilus assembly protein n=1 Tax=uncultured Sphingomonas sp. TaxID=158754 RepID=UPI0025E3DB26|nr:TadE/TadG family type IV pilus assembly protein [uncultured Sphingomonas sp.]